MSIIGVSDVLAGAQQYRNQIQRMTAASFQTVLDASMEGKDLENILKERYPGLKYHVMDTTKINPSLWQRNDYPFEMFFEDNVDASVLDWKPSAKEPFMLDSGVQARLNAAKGKYAVIVPPVLERKLENDPQLSQDIMKKISVLIKEQDTLPSSIDSFSIALDEEGNISNYRLSCSGGEIMLPSEKELQKKLQKKEEEKEEAFKEQERQQCLAANRALRQKLQSEQAGDESIIQQINGGTDIEEIKAFLEDKYHVNVVVTDYSCEKTDSEAESYDLALLKQCDLTGGRNVIISREILSKMKKDSVLRQKVIQSIKDIPFTGKTTGGVVKSNGVFIHEDGTGGYYLEFDWGDEEEGKKVEKTKAVYSAHTGKDISTRIEDVFYNTGYPAELLAVLTAANQTYRHIGQK